MSLVRLTKELEETARQSAEMAEGIADAIQLLSGEAGNDPTARMEAVQQIVIALQAQDRIEQRCTNMIDAVRNLVALDTSIDHARFDKIWAHLTLDELRVPELSGIAGRAQSGDVDLF